MDAGGGGDGSRPHRREPRPVAQSRDPLGPQFFERAADRAGHRVPDRRGPQRGCRRGAVVSELRASLPEQEPLMAAPQRDLPLAGAEPGWRRPRLAPSLAEVYRTVPVSTGAWWRKALAFAGPGYLVAVGYMDPGNWATDLAGGSRFGYALLATIAGCFLFEIVISRPDLAAVAGGFLPTRSILADPDKLYIAIGILGATVMPHNLYLHSSVVQTRAYEETAAGKRMAVKYAFLDSTVALSFALFINAAILIVAAGTFHRAGHTGVAEIQEAYQLLSPLLGVAGASAVFALALLASGQNSTLTGTLAGQIVMEGFLNIRIRPWLRRLITRLIAIVPAALTAIFFGESGTAKLLILSQVILSLQLSFAVFPLVWFTSDRVKMGEFVNPTWVKALAYLVAVVIAGLNAWLLAQIFRGWLG